MLFALCSLLFALALPMPRLYHAAGAHQTPPVHLRWRPTHKSPVCARCTGFYAGLIVYLIFNCLYSHPYNLSMFFISMILMIPVAVDGVTQYFGSRESTNNLRFITGFIGGIGLIIFLKIIIRGFINVL